MTGVELIAAERARQLGVEGWTAEHDDNEHHDGQLIDAAVCYAVNKDPLTDGCVCVEGAVGDVARPTWPWADEWDKREKHGRVRSLAIAGALIAAEIDRLQRAQEFEGLTAASRVSRPAAGYSDDGQR